MCMVNMLFRKDISKEVLVEIFNKYKVHPYNHYLYMERVNRIDDLSRPEKEVEDERLKQDLLAYSAKTTIDESDILFHNFNAYPDYNIIGVESEMLYKRGFTAIGHCEEYYGLMYFIGQEVYKECSYNGWKLDFDIKNYNLNVEDLNFWDRIFSTMLTEYGMQDIGIYYMYPEMAEEPVTFKRRKLEDIIDRDLVTMEVNRVLFIEK